MITIAVFALVVFHPGFGFQNKFNELESEEVSGTGMAASKEAISLVVVEQQQSSA
jgi:hypothetical protein